MPQSKGKVFRALAKRAEQFMRKDFFTCNEVDAATNGSERYAYEDLFGLSHKGSWGEPRGNEEELWNSDDCGNIRVLMLCFAAALADAGDL